MLLIKNKGGRDHPGKGSGQLKKKVRRFLQIPHIKPLYHRIKNDSKHFVRLFIYFKI